MSEKINLRQAAEMALETLIELEELLPVGINLAAVAALKKALNQPDQLENCKKLLIERTSSLTKANYKLEQLNKQEPAGVVVAALLASSTVMIKWTSDYRPKVGDLIYTTQAPIPEGWQLVPIEPTEEMIDCGAQGMASFQEESIWPDSWDATQVKGMRHDATKAYRYMLAVAPKYGE
jgi:hypothetical protein